ncbi:MAG: hypothetical protein U0414_26820 [Polyangiaceae bacterium]
MDFILSLVLFVTTGCPTPDLVATSAPRVEAPSPVHAPPPVVEPAPEPKTCAPNPSRSPCAGAIGFCPVWRCVDGEWVDVRPRRGNVKPGDPLAY